jgi:hypothetical protein
MDNLRGVRFGIRSKDLGDIGPMGFVSIGWGGEICEASSWRAGNGYRGARLCLWDMSKVLPRLGL